MRRAAGIALARLGARLGAGVGVVALAVVSTGALAAAAAKKVPYYASISAGKARMRSGPARNYPASWMYQRADLPVKVVAVYERGGWLKVEDPAGVQGWIAGPLISDTRTAIVVGQVAELQQSPEPGSKVVWRAAPGVVGRLSKCARGWCHLDVKGRGGFVEISRLWGIDATEQF